MEAAWMMMQQEEPEDFVIGTGESHSVEEFLALAFREAGMGDYARYVEIDPIYYRPQEVYELIADSRKAKKILGWEAKTKFGDLVKIMVTADLEKINQPLKRSN